MKANLPNTNLGTWVSHAKCVICCIVSTGKQKKMRVLPFRILLEGVCRKTRQIGLVQVDIPFI